MGRPRKIYKCISCGTTERVNRKTMLCYICAMEKLLTVIKQLQHKQGPYYEKWRKGIQELHRQLRAKRGPHYEKWRQGMIKALERGE